ncbi:hypothetical protein OAQ84_01790 [Bdellovibrionales bacterium]|nr:hypothetical protein [Bdellovibrionales bacterium]
MDIQILTDFFKWSTILSGGVYIYTAVMVIFAPDFIYRYQSRWFKISREVFNTVIYAYLGFYKVIFIVFVLVPYLALLIIN